MTELEKTILRLKNEIKRDNYLFLRRRINKGNGKKTLGWIVKRTDSTQSLEHLDFNELQKLKYQLKK